MSGGNHDPTSSNLAGRPEGPGAVGRRTKGLGHFITYIEFERPDGVLATWDSRRARKSAGGSPEAGTWWAPAARGWWIGILFAIGSTLFALGSIAPYASAVGAWVDSLTYFIGSIFFTSAGFLQYREAVDAGPSGPARGWRRVLCWQLDRIDFLATGIQLLGTLFFNLSTANALQTDLTSTAARHHIWRPDALGSICFLVASALAWVEVSHGWLSFQPRQLSWWITLLNLVGSIAFGVSAAAAFIVPSTGELKNAALANLGTLVGALCFLVGAILLLPERTRTAEAA